MRIQLYSTRHLRGEGLGTRDIRAAVARGSLQRLRRGWYCTPATAPEIAAACRVGGALTCVAALRVHGAWTLEAGVHVRVAHGVAMKPIPGAPIHRTAERVIPGIDSVEDALREAVGCADLRALVTVVDSLAQRRLLSSVRIASILSATPRGRQALQLHDPAAESGIETLVRLALRRHRIRFRSQVPIAGVGRVDLLIGDRLVIEADGFEWHGDREAFERDRRRDRELARRGYIVIRASYAAVLADLDAVVAAVLDIVRRRDHRWRAVHRAQLSGAGYLVDTWSTR